MGFSLAHLIVLLLVIFVLFGAGKLPKVMADIGKGIKNLRNELSDDNKDVALVRQEVSEKDKK